MSEVLSAFDSIARKANAEIHIEDGDYYGEDGLLYCGKCHTKKQHRDMYFRVGNVTMCLCKCAKEAQEREDAAREQQKQADAIRKYRAVGFPEEDMKNWTFANDDRANETLSNAMRNYVENFDKYKAAGKGLLLYGDTGRGKTFAACCIANALIDKGVPVLVTQFTRIRNELWGMSEGRQEYLDNLNKFPLLVIDDLASESKTEYMGELVYSVIDSRERAKLPIIITTNLTKEELERPADMTYKRIFSRLFGNCIPVKVEGKDRRKQRLIAEYGNMRNELFDESE